MTRLTTAWRAPHHSATFFQPLHPSEAVAEVVAPGAALIVDGLMLAWYGWRITRPAPFVLKGATFARCIEAFVVILLVPIAAESWNGSRADPTGLLRTLAVLVAGAALLAILIAEGLAWRQRADLIVLNVRRDEIHRAIAHALRGHTVAERHGIHDVDSGRATVDVRMGANPGAAVQVRVAGTDRHEIQKILGDALRATRGDRRLLGALEGGLGVAFIGVGIALLAVGLR